jgi:hypothetical protein
MKPVHLGLTLVALALSVNVAAALEPAQQRGLSFA